MMLFFFFSSRRRHTRFKCDWSSDVCSSDLYHRCPAIPPSRLAQATQGRKIHMRPSDQNILARELRKQLLPRRRSLSLVNVENRGDLGMLQLDAQCMDDVAPKKDSLSL